jgi:hypothetical protein
VPFTQSGACDCPTAELACTYTVHSTIYERFSVSNSERKITIWLSSGSKVTLHDVDGETVGDEVELSKDVLCLCVATGLAAPEAVGTGIQRNHDNPVIAEFSYPTDMRVFVGGKRVANRAAVELVAAGLAIITSEYLDRMDLVLEESGALEPA